MRARVAQQAAQRRPRVATGQRPHFTEPKPEPLQRVETRSGPVLQQQLGERNYSPGVEMPMFFVNSSIHR